MRIILGSASPRRRELLGQIGLEFEIKVSDVEEVITSTDPKKIVEELATGKARAVYESLAGDDDVTCSAGEAELLVIGADTIVACDGRVLGKPGSPQEAREMLSSLSGREHQVYTGVCLIHATHSGVEEKVFHECTEVAFCPMTEEEIAEYVASGDPMDKAGAYGIQGFCARYISGIRGDYNNVVGLPVGRLYQEIKQWMH